MIELSSEFDGSIHRLILNRPARRNALTPELARALAQEIEQIEESGDARVILLSGAGGHYCAALDLRWLDSLGS
ncbi:MAG: enoyl-CoA hydratase/isomerase family protein, partial [Gemmatimonadales bacterium]